MKSRGITLMAIIAGSLALAGAAISPPIRNACAQQAHMSYAEDVAPIFRGWCVSCHQPGGQGYNASGLDLTSYDGLMKGTKFGPMVIASQPDNSNLVVLIEGRAKIQMPYGHKPLPECLRQNIWSWIFEGAKNN
jgi:Planctomycete cytochrome C